MIISSKANPIIKKFVSLSDKKYRREYGEYLVESVKAVDECIRAGKEITRIICTEAYAHKYGGATTVSDELFGKISTEKTPQGVIASVKIPQELSLKPDGCCLLLDRIQDPGNLGTIIRTANAAGYEDLYLIDCADPYSPKAVRASMGGIFYVRVHTCSYEEAFNALQGYKFITADMGGEDVFEFVPPEKFCLCIGNEGNGVGSEVVEKSDYVIRIPMRESCESLNAAVSAGIAMYILKNNIRRK